MSGDGQLSAEQIQELTPQLADAYSSLVEEARSGDELALREMLGSCQRYLLFIANQELDPQLRAKCGASDIVQNTMVQAVANFDQFQGGHQAALLGWLRRILLNEIGGLRRQYLVAEKRDIRRENSQKVIPNSAGGHPGMIDPERTPASELRFREEAERLTAALQTLSEDHQIVLQLRNWERLPFSEIGTQMGRSEDAAKKLWARSLESLRTALDRLA